MKSFEKTVTVTVGPESAFSLVSDFEQHTTWSGHGLSVARNGGPDGVGAKYDTQAKQFGTQKEQSVVTEVQPPSSFKWESTGALGKVTHWFKIAPAGEGSSITKGVEFTEPKFVAKMMMFKIAKDAPKALESDLSKIKNSLES